MKCGNWQMPCLIDFYPYVSMSFARVLWAFRSPPTTVGYEAHGWYCRWLSVVCPISSACGSDVERCDVHWVSQYSLLSENTEYSSLSARVEYIQRWTGISQSTGPEPSVRQILCSTRTVALLNVWRVVLNVHEPAANRRAASIIPTASTANSDNAALPAKAAASCKEGLVQPATHISSATTPEVRWILAQQTGGQPVRSP